MTEFDNITITLKKGQDIMSELRAALEKEGHADRMDSDNGIFIMDNVTVVEIGKDNVKCKVDYEYGD